MFAWNEMIDEKYRRPNNFHRNFCLASLTAIIIRNYFFFESDDSELSFTTTILLKFVFCLMQQKSLSLCLDFRHDQYLPFRENFSLFASFNFEKCSVPSCHASIHFVDFTDIGPKLLFEFLFTADAAENVVVFDFTAIEMLKVMIVILLKSRLAEKIKKVGFADFWKSCFANFWFNSFLFCSIFRASCSRIFRLSKSLLNKDTTTFNLRVFLKISIRFSIEVLARCQSLNRRW